MARVTVEAAVKRLGNRFNLVLLAAKRARQLQMEGKKALIDSQTHSYAVTALLEIEAGLIDGPKIAEIERETQHAQDLSDIINAPLRWQNSMLSP